MPQFLKLPLYPVVATATLLSVISCSWFKSTPPPEPNFNLTKKLPNFSNMSTTGAGHLGLEWAFKSKSLCQGMSQELKVEMINLESGKSLATKRSCQDHQLFITAQDPQEMGTFRIIIDQEFDDKVFTGPPRLGVNYLNPNFSSGGDHFIEGAVKLGADQKVNDAINPGAGDFTDWIYLENAINLSVRLTADYQGREIQSFAEFRHQKNLKVVKRLRLPIDQSITLKAPIGTDLYVVIQGKPLGLLTKYQLARKDFKGEGAAASLHNTAQFSVSQHYPLAEKYSFIIAQHSDDLKVEIGKKFEIHFPQRASGESVICSVTAIKEKLFVCESIKKMSLKNPREKLEVSPL